MAKTVKVVRISHILSPSPVRHVRKSALVSYSGWGTWVSGWPCQERERRATTAATARDDGEAGVQALVVPCRRRVADTSRIPLFTYCDAYFAAASCHGSVGRRRLTWRLRELADDEAAGQRGPGASSGRQLMGGGFADVPLARL